MSPSGNCDQARRKFIIKISTVAFGVLPGSCANTTKQVIYKAIESGQRVEIG